MSMHSFVKIFYFYVQLNKIILCLCTASQSYSLSMYSFMELFFVYAQLRADILCLCITLWRYSMYNRVRCEIAVKTLGTSGSYQLVRCRNFLLMIYSQSHGIYLVAPQLNAEVGGPPAETQKQLQTVSGLQTLPQLGVFLDWTAVYQRTFQ